MKKIKLENKHYTLEEVYNISVNPFCISLSEELRDNIVNSRLLVEDKSCAKEPIYGINTGFGKLSQVVIPKDQLYKLQKNLLMSHSVGIGKPIDDDVVWTMLLIKIISLSKGFSGVTHTLIEQLISLLNSGFLPLIPSQGSVGASGDLAPLAHMALPIIGLGEVR